MSDAGLSASAAGASTASAVGGARTASAADVVRSYLTAFASGDAELIAGHVSKDFTNDHMSALGEGCCGRDEYRRRLGVFLASLPGLRYDVERMVVDAGQVAVTYRLTATSEGHPVDVRGAMLLDVVDGLITSRSDYWDSLTFLRQTGHA